MHKSILYGDGRCLLIQRSTTNKTLGEVDTNRVFDRTKANPKITGIAGDVIEQSVLFIIQDRNKGE